MSLVCKVGICHNSHFIKLIKIYKIEFLPCCIEKWNEYIAGSTTADRHGIVKPDQIEALPERIDEGGCGQKTVFRQVDRHGIVKEKTVVKLNAQLVSLVGENGAEMLFLLLKTLFSISAPEMAG